MKRPPDFVSIGRITHNTFGGLPDFRIAADRPVGDGSPAVCDDGPVPLPIGGVPAIPDADFGSNIGAVNDFSCRFTPRTQGGTVNGPCTRNGFDADSFVSEESVVQFCGLIGAELGFPVGRTRITAAGTDIRGRPGPPQSIVINVIP